MTQAYCVKCKKKVEMKDPINITMKNGKGAVQGRCPACYTTVFRINLDDEKKTITERLPIIPQVADNPAKEIVSPQVIVNNHTESRIIEDLDSVVTFIIPPFIDPGSSHEILIIIDNKSTSNINMMNFDFSDLAHFFEIQQELNIRSIRRGLKLTKRLKIKPLFEEGSFPVEIKTRIDNVEYNKIFTIKVGGTEIY